MIQKPQIHICSSAPKGKLKPQKGLWLLLCLTLLVWGCEEPLLPSDTKVLVDISTPPGIPPMEVEAGNELTTRRVELGKKLFFDPFLSRDSTVSCGSCHHQVHGFADFSPVSSGVQGKQGKRNATALFNLGWHEVFNHDGGTATIELQLQVPITDSLEMDMTFAELIERLEKDDEYPLLFDLAYPDRGIGSYSITRAIGAFERTLVSFNSPYDRYTYYGEEDALNESQKRGMELFFSERTQCASCHEGFNFRREGFENNGIYLNYADSGRASITILPEDRGKFKIPSLRNVGVTRPYMHDGSIWSLAEVVDHYASGGQGHPAQSDLIQGFSITDQERTDLINFLLALTDQSFLSDPSFAP